MARIVAVLGMALLFFSNTGRAAEVEPLLPGDTEVVVTLQLDRLKASPLGTRYLKATIDEAIKAMPPLREMLALAGPDVSRVTIALTSIASNTGFIIVRGKFDRTKIAAQAENVAVERKDAFKIHKSDKGIVYEIDGEPQPAYATFPDDSTLVISNKRDLLTDAEKRGKPKKEMIALIEKVAGKHEGWLAILPATASAIAPVADEQKQLFEKLEGLIGVLKVQTSIRAELTLLAPTAEGATQVEKVIADWVAYLKALLRQSVKEKPDLAPLVDVADLVRTSAMGKNVLILVEISAKQVEKMLAPASK